MNSREESFGPYKNCLVQNLNNHEAMTSPNNEYQNETVADSKSSSNLNPHLLNNFALSNKRVDKKKVSK